MWALSVLFAAGLIGLGGLIIRDLPDLRQPLSVADFAEPGLLERQRAEAQAAYQASEAATRNAEAAARDLNDAIAEREAIEGAFSAWLGTRIATQDPSQDTDLIARTQEVEAARQREALASARLSEAEARRSAAWEAQPALDAAHQNALAVPYRQLSQALELEQLKVFGLRLAVLLPLILAAIWMVLRKRASAYWPLYRGFVIASLYAFFVELVPYLPSYGGYVHAGIGVVLVGVVGHMLIRFMRRYLADQKAREARAEPERRAGIAYEVAIRKLAAKTCPGCDRALEPGPDNTLSFCVHCGIRHQEPCTSCGTARSTFHRHCGSCGTPNPGVEAGAGA
jgi:hypothetical protein